MKSDGNDAFTRASSGKLEEKESAAAYARALCSYREGLSLMNSDPTPVSGDMLVLKTVLYLNTSASYLGLHDWDGAAYMAKHATALEPRNAKAYFRLGSALMGSGDYVEAITSLVSAVELEPNQARKQQVRDLLEQAKARYTKQRESEKNVYGKMFKPASGSTSEQQPQPQHQGPKSINSVPKRTAPRKIGPKRTQLVEDILQVEDQLNVVEKGLVTALQQQIEQERLIDAKELREDMQEWREIASNGGIAAMKVDEREYAIQQIALAKQCADRAASGAKSAGMPERLSTLEREYMSVMQELRAEAVATGDEKAMQKLEDLRKRLENLLSRFDFVTLSKELDEVYKEYGGVSPIHSELNS